MPEAADVPFAVPDKVHLFNFSELALGELLGSGAFGEVRKVAYLGAKYALKRAKSESALRELEAEVALHAVLEPHSRIVRLMGATKAPPGLLIQLYPERSVQDYLQSGKQMTLLQVRAPLRVVSRAHRVLLLRPWK